MLSAWIMDLRRTPSWKLRLEDRQLGSFYNRPAGNQHCVWLLVGKEAESNAEISVFASVWGLEGKLLA